MRANAPAIVLVNSFHKYIYTAIMVKNFIGCLIVSRCTTNVKESQDMLPT